MLTGMRLPGGLLKLIKMTTVLGYSTASVLVKDVAPSPMTRPRRVQVEADLDPEKRGKVGVRVKGRTGTVPKAQGDLEAEMVHQEDGAEIVPLTIEGPLLPPTGNHFEEPHPVERRIAKYAHST